MDECIGDYLYSSTPIGKGSYSVVYRGRNMTTHKDVAIKKIYYQQNKKQNIEREIKIMKKLNHKHIIKLYDYIYQNDYIYIIMEYSDMGDLAHFLNGKPLKEKYAQKYLRQIAEAVEYLLDKNILHRDIKPHNILLTHDGNLKLSDFGFAKIFKNDEMTKTICGSPIYMAPEIIKNNKYNNKTDLWSIGVILYEMLVGKPPYKAKTHIQLLHKIDNRPIYFPKNIKISEKCKNLIQQLLQKNPENRISWNDFFKHEWVFGHCKIRQMEPIKNIVIYDNYQIINNSSKNINIPKVLQEQKEKKREKKKYDTYSLTKSKEFVKEKLQNITLEDSNRSINMNYKKITPHAVSKPINIRGSNKSRDVKLKIQHQALSECYISPMFNTPIQFTPNNTNGYVVVNNKTDKHEYKYKYSSSENNSENNSEDDEETIVSDREVSNSLLNYMGSTVNYLKSYCWQ